MASDVKTSGLKQLKVDNWSTFFMQRLQLLFAKGDSCDLTLRFHTGQELKVHSLVLRTCTSHFETLPKEDNVIILPEVLSYTVVFPIINFMYSGKLEFKPELQPKLISIAKLLNITILLKLLLTQKSDTPVVGSAPPRQPTKPLPSPLSHDCCKPAHQNNKPPSFMTNYGLFHGKKLPFWRKRRPLLRYDSKQAEDELGPMRFSWPENEPADWILISSPSFCPLSFDSVPILKAPVKVESEYTPTPQRRVIESRMITTNDSDDDDDRFDEQYSSEEESSPPPPLPPPPPPRRIPSTPPILKPILKSPSSEPSGPPPSKKVRFSLGTEDKENTASPLQIPNPSQPLESTENVTTPQTESSEDTVSSAPPVTTTQPLIPTQTVNSNQSVTPVQSYQSLQNSNVFHTINTVQNPASNHAKIIAEVLKKYPDLVRNKNVKLKITSPKPKTENGLIGVSEEKASYVVLRPAVRPPEKLSLPPSMKITDPPMSPYVCDHCPELRYDQYADFRKHVQEVHNGRLDVRICEHCGYKASKRNLLLYHLFTKHNVAPPSHMKFPKCPECTYIALSEGLLAKHMNNHQLRDLTKESPKEFPCDICKTVMRSQATLNAHKVTCKPGNEQRHIVCDLCKTSFRTNISLNAHLKDCQGKSATPTTSTLFTEDGDHPVEMIEVPIIETVNVDKGDHTLVQIPSGIILADNQNMAILPTTEADPLGGVTTGIATSIGLTVALPQDQAVILLHGDNQEYIVPEFISGSFTTTGNIAYTTSQNQVFYLGSTPGNGNQQEVLQLEEIKISQPTPSTSALQKKNKENETLELGKSVHHKKGGEGISQSLIINVPGGLSSSAELQQNGLILIDTNKGLDGNLVQTHVTRNEGTVNSNSSSVILSFAENPAINTNKPLECVTIEDDDDEKPVDKNTCIEDEKSFKGLEGNELIGNNKEGGDQDYSQMQKSTSSEMNLIENVSCSSQGETLDSGPSGSSDIVSENQGSSLEKEPSEPAESGKVMNKIFKSDSGCSVVQRNMPELSAGDNESTSNLEHDEIEDIAKQVSVENSQSKEVISDFDKEEMKAVSCDESNNDILVIKEEKGKDMIITSDEEKNKDMIVVSDDEKSKDILLSGECAIETEQMQVEEVREDMIVDDDKDEVCAMDVEDRSTMEVEESIDLKEPKDAMDIEETDKSTDVRVESLVKDWGFDDDESEEIIDDPDCKPLRSDIDIQL